MQNLLLQFVTFVFVYVGEIHVENLYFKVIYVFVSEFSISLDNISIFRQKYLGS